MTFPRLSSRIIALSAALVALLTTITCTEQHLKVIRRERFGEIENFYLTTRTRNDKSYNQSEEDATSEFKNTICLTIFSSGSFVKEGKEPVNMENEIELQELMIMNADLAKEILFTESIFKAYKYLKPTVLKNIIVARETVPEHDSFPEYVFACPIWNKSKSEVENVYVSEEYKLDGDISARFLFVNRKNKMVVMSVAEEPAMVKATWPEDIELAYIEKRGKRGSEPATKKEDDPICGHNTERQIEICSSILSSQHFDGSLIYYPEPMTIGGCKKIKIGFRLEGRTVPTENEEWTLSCAAQLKTKESPDKSRDEEKSENRKSVGETSHKTFFVSRAYDGPGRALLYTLDTENNLAYLQSLIISNVININE